MAFSSYALSMSECFKAVFAVIESRIELGEESESRVAFDLPQRADDGRGTAKEKVRRESTQIIADVKTA